MSLVACHVRSKSLVRLGLTTNPCMSLLALISYKPLSLHLGQCPHDCPMAWCLSPDPTYPLGELSPHTLPPEIRLAHHQKLRPRATLSIPRIPLPRRLRVPQALRRSPPRGPIRLWLRSADRSGCPSRRARFLKHGRTRRMSYWMRTGTRPREELCESLLSLPFHLRGGKELMGRLKEASSGYFSDYSRASSASGGKLWIGPPVLIREDVSGCVQAECNGQ
jgi:hypothetical protein